MELEIMDNGFFNKIEQISNQSNMLMFKEIMNQVNRVIDEKTIEIRKETSLELEQVKNDLLRENAKNKQELRSEFENTINSIAIEMTDKFIKNEKMAEIQLKKVNNKLYNLDEQLIQTKDKADVSYKRTNTLSFTGRSLKLKKAVHSKVYQVNAPKGTLECTLFHGKLVAQIYSKLYEFYDVSKYGLIPDDSYEECINMINRWRPDINYKKKIMSDYTKQINENGSLPITYEKAYHALLNKTGGNF